MADQGDQAPGEGLEYDSMDQAAMQQAQEDLAAAQALSGMPLVGAPIGAAVTGVAAAEIADIQHRADMKAQLAQSMSASTTLRVDPDQVDKLANFFEDEAQALWDRNMVVNDLSMVQPPGADPVSTQAVTAYSLVATGDSQAYLENYLKLADVFQQTAHNLRASAAQTRSDDQGAEDNFRSGLV